MIWVIYFDNSATSYPKPKEVIEATVYALENYGSSGRSFYDLSLKSSRCIYSVREKIAELFHYGFPEQVAFTSNSTEALNIAIKGLFHKGEHVITTVLEHNSVLRPLYEIEKNGVEITIVSADSLGRITPEAIEAEIKENTKGIVCTHVSNLTGYCLDIEKIGKICQENNLYFVLDTSQSAGVLDVDMEKCNITALCFTGHKGLYGPQGTGGIILRKDVPIKVWKSGGTGVQTFSKNQPDSMPVLLETGTLNVHGIAGLGAGIDYINKKGKDVIYHNADILLRKFYDEIKDIPEITIYGEYSQKERGAVIAINIADEPSGYVSDYLYQEYEICTRSGGHCAPLLHQHFQTEKQGMVRFSFSHQNTMEEIEIAVEALKRYIRE